MEYTDTQKKFIQDAMATISDQPEYRLLSPSRAVIGQQNFVFDAHGHFFDGHCMNAGYLAIRLLATLPASAKAWIWKLITGHTITGSLQDKSVDDLVEEIYNKPELILGYNEQETYLNRMEEAWNELSMEVGTQELKAADKLLFDQIGGKLLDIFRLLKSKRMEKVLAMFLEKYAVNHVLADMGENGLKMISIALGMDLNSGWQNSCKKSYTDQNCELGRLAKSHPVLPFLPVDPRRAELKEEENLYDAFLKAFDKNNPSFFGVKCYPALGYLPSDSRLRPIFEICEKKNIPVLTHCGGSIISTFSNPVKVNRNGNDEEITGATRSIRAAKLNEPLEWLPVLESFNQLKLCFGHFGSAEAWKDNNDSKAHRIPEILKLMETYQVYADFSFNLESKTATEKFVEKMFDGSADADMMQQRTLYGTDFWVVLPVSDLNADQSYFLQRLQSVKEKLLKQNVLNYLGLNNV